MTMKNPHLRILRPLLIGATLVGALVLALTTGGQAQSGAGRAEPAPISPHLETRLARSAAPVPFLVILDDQLDPEPVVRAARAAGGDAVARRTALYQALTAHAAATQAPLRAWLDAQGVAYQPFYLVNMIAVEGDLALARQLAQQPAVNRLAANPEVAGLAGMSPQKVARSWLPQRWAMASIQAQALPYGLSNTKAVQVWELGYRGAGIVVGSQDTGVDWDHPALQEAYRGWNAISGTVDHVYNWGDAFGRNQTDVACSPDPQVPCDDNGHGTHTVGTMVGDATAMSNTVIGMAPDAQWIGCRNMRGGVGTPASYATCFEFLLAPYPQGGNSATDGRPELGAHVINNSWGCPPSEGCDVNSLRTIVENVRAAGIVVVASAGNEGPGCSTIANPIGLYDAAFTVGAVDSNNRVASFSSRGPVTVDRSGRRKPDLAAPGVGVRSAWPGNSVNFLLSGTSMAAPHVAGAVALLWSAAPALIGDVDLTEQILLRSATALPTFSPCPTYGPAYPNEVTGFGQLDVLNAVLVAQQPVTVALNFFTDALHPVTVTAALLFDNDTWFTYPVNTVQNNSTEWSRVFAGTYYIAGLDEQGNIILTEPEKVTIENGEPFSTTVRIVQNRAFLSCTSPSLCMTLSPTLSILQVRSWLPHVAR